MYNSLYIFIGKLYKDYILIKLNSSRHQPFGEPHCWPGWSGSEGDGTNLDTKPPVKHPRGSKGDGITRKTQSSVEPLKGSEGEGANITTKPSVEHSVKGSEGDGTALTTKQPPVERFKGTNDSGTPLTTQPSTEPPVQIAENKTDV